MRGCGSKNISASVAVDDPQHGGVTAERSGGDLGNRLGGRARSLAYDRDLSPDPLDREKVKSGATLADFDRADDIRMQDTSAVLRFAEKAGDCRLVLAQLLAQQLDGDDAVLRMRRAIHGGCPALADEAMDRVSSEQLTDE